MAIKGMASSSSPFFPPNFLLQIQNPHNPLEEDQQDSRGLTLTMLGGKISRSEGNEYDLLEEEDHEYECSELGGGGGAGEMMKKRRLGIEQVRSLEKSFVEMGNKLEPERKMQLARALGLEPRQVAVWFQNRRARWKNKQLEKDYDVLKRHFEDVKSQNQALHSHNKKLQTEISSLLHKGRETTTTSELINLNKETEGGSSCSNNTISDHDQNNNSTTCAEINLNIMQISTTTTVLLPAEANSTDQQSIPFFPNFVLQAGPKIIADHQHNINPAGPVENFSNLLCNMDIDQSAFWQWADPHTFH